MLRQVHASAGHVGDEQHLEYHLEDCQQPGHHHQQVRLVGERLQRAGDHAEHAVDEETEGGDAQQDVIEVALLLGLELEVLHATETYDYGEEGQGHDQTVRRVGQVDCQQSELRVVDENEEQDQADQRTNQKQQTEEEAFARADAVHSSVTWQNTIVNSNWNITEDRFCPYQKVLQ